MMKYKVIKEFAGIEVGAEIPISDRDVKYMIESGYVEPIEEKEDPKPRGRKKKIDLESEGRENKAAE